MRVEVLESRTMLSAGQADTSFGDRGVVIAYPGTDAIDSRPVAIFSASAVSYDGRIVTAVMDRSSQQVLIKRFNSDGSADRRFGPVGEGFINVEFAGRGSAHNRLQVVPLRNGGLLVLSSGLLRRFNLDGSLDTQFADGGTLSLFTSPFTESPWTIAALPDDSILLGGSVPSGSLAVYRLQSNGSLELSFGDNGLREFDIQPLLSVPHRTGYGDHVFTSSSDGTTYLVSTYLSRPNDEDLDSAAGSAIVRFNSDGALDTDFGLNGLKQIGTDSGVFGPLGELGFVEIRAARATPDGGLLFATQETVVQVTADGALRGPALDLSSEDSAASIKDVLAQRDGRFIVAGIEVDSSATAETQFSAQVWRYSADGTRESSFGEGGIAGNLFARDALGPLSLQFGADGSIVVFSGECVESTDASRGVLRRLWRNDGPAAEANALSIESSRSGSQVLTVTYRDDRAIDTSSFDNRDLRITGPNGFVAYAKFDRIIKSKSGGGWIRARYKLAAPGGSWDAADNGSYSIRLRAGQVSDIDGHSVEARTIASFDVAIAPASARVAQLSAARTPIFAASRKIADEFFESPGADLV